MPTQEAAQKMRASKPSLLTERPLFKSKSEEKRIRTLTMADPKGLTATFHVWPSAPTGYGVAIKLDGKGIKSQLCMDKAAIIKFLDENL